MYFKIIKYGKSCNGGMYEWSLPHDGKPGEWSTTIRGKLVPCHRGYHVARNSYVFSWVYDDCDIYVCEIKDKSIDVQSKVVTRGVRLIKKVEMTKDQFYSIVAEVWDHLNDDDFNFAQYRAVNEWRNAVAFVEQFYDGMYAMSKLCQFLYAARCCGRTWVQQDELVEFIFNVFCKHLGFIEQEV